MGTTVILIILAVIVLAAVASAVKHMKGKGGCCGGGGTVAETKELEGEKIGELHVRIEGMHCENCKNSVERAVNRLEGMVCKVNLRKNMAVISYSREPDMEEVREAIERLDFRVVEMEK